ncbi:hypothetical protein NP493_289g03007 [Ridgeia piscesae]|uniref:Uncharacterized protein n=1 Tax=Ridgeia piscesae TaxID=27915 RepID=A0AAD9UBI3_RIDPI|nr:hypothetical protein NP493_289g03007 [Ridgeia piscesae]
MGQLESAHGRLIKQSLGLSKRSHNIALLKALNIEKVEDIVTRNVLSLYNRIFNRKSSASTDAAFIFSFYFLML